MRKIVAVLLLLVLCFVVSPVFANKATDVEGTVDDYPPYDYYNEIVQYAESQQIAKDYITTAYKQPTPEQVLGKLKTDDIFFFNGHCNPGEMGIRADTLPPHPPTYFIYAENVEQRQLKGLGLKYMQFIFFDCCESAKTDKTYGNLIKTAVDEGAKCAFGFRNGLDREDAGIVYGKTFWDEARKGTTWNFCHWAAVETLKRDSRTRINCTYKNQYCGYDTLEKEGGRACSSIMASPQPETDEMIQPAAEAPIPTPAQLPETANITFNQAQDLIREFTGNPNLNATYEKPDYELSPNIYKFTADNSSFYINSVTHRVESTTDFDPEEILIVKPNTKEVSLDEAYIIAENFAKSKCPQFWNTTPGKTGVKLMRKYKQEHGEGDYEYVIGWHEEYYYPDKNTPGYITVTGLKYIAIHVAPGGEIFTYDENLTPRDESVSLKPDITEEQAWAIAKKHFADHYTVLTDDDKTSFGLELKPFSNQTLTWSFEANNEKHHGDNLIQGGEIAIDAHDGSVALYLPT